MKTDQPYLELINDSIEQVFEYIGDFDRESFLQNDMLKDACLTRLIVIGEYSAKISEALKTKFPEIEWSEMKAARNFYVHAYGQVNWEMIWNTIHDFLPDLKPKIVNVIAQMVE